MIWASLLLLYFVLIPGYIYLRFERLVARRADRRIVATPADHGLTYEEHVIPVDRDISLRAWWMPAEGAPRDTLVFVHGNKRNPGHFCRYFAKLVDVVGVNVFAVFLRGYGESGGHLSLSGTSADIQRCLEHIRDEKRLSFSDIVILGKSQGGVFAARAAADAEETAPLHGLVVESGVSSPAEMLDLLLKKSLILYPLAFYDLVGRKTSYLDTHAIIGRLRTRTLVVHGTQDRLVPLWMAEKNASARDGVARLFVEGAGHGDCSTHPAYHNALRRMFVV